MLQKNKIQIIGIRPGEKLHEEIVTVSDSLNTIDCGAYFVILPSTDSLSKSSYDDKNKIKSKRCEYGFCYNSHNNIDRLTINDLKTLAKEFLEKMISYGKQTIDQSDIDSVIKILKSDWLTQGPAVENFENDLKNIFGSKYACAVSNGTAALHLVAKVLNWSSGDIILTTPITFLATANCIEYVGATVDFVDINNENFTIDVNLLEEKIISYKNRGKKIKAVIAVDYAGHPCDWESLKKIADKYEFQLINDNCHALGASYNGDSKYAIKYANFVTQSFHPVKMITTGEGGAVITNDLESFKKLQILRSHGITKDPKVIGDSQGPWYYEMHEIGYNYRITDFQCALGSNQLKN